MGLWSSLFNSDDIISKGTDAIISAGDKLFYTSEEKADMNLKMKEFHLKILTASEPFKVAQRLIAIWFSFLFGSSFIIGMGITIFNMIAVYKQTLAGKIANDIVTIPLEPLFALIASFNMGTIVAIIIAWYFSGGVVNSFNSAKK